MDAIKKIPAYGKFFKNLVAKRRRFTKDEKVIVSQAASVALYKDYHQSSRTPEVSP